MKWRVVEDDDKCVTWIRTQQAQLYKVKDQRKSAVPHHKIAEEVKKMRAMLGTAMTCREELDNITHSIRYVVWPISSDLKKYFVSEMFHLIGAKALWEEIAMSVTDKKLMTVATDGNIVAKLHQCAYDFDYIKRAVESQCEKWRVTFPRLFLMSDERLINFMEDFPKSCGFSELFHFGSLVLHQDKEIRGVTAERGETLRLIHPVKIKPTSCPAKVMKKLECSMRESLKEEIMCALRSRTSKDDWYLTHLPQAICVSLWVEWTRSIEEALKGKEAKTGLTQSLELYRNELHHVVQLLNDKSEAHVGRNNIVCSTFHGMVHILEELVRDKATLTENSPIWRNKIKFYWKNDTIIVKCEDNVVEYGYEFYGYRGLAIHHSEGHSLAFPLMMSSFKHLVMASISGETGAGKNLTVQQLGFLLGKPVYTYSCTSDTKMRDLENVMRAAGYSSGILIACELNRMQDEKKCMELWAKMLELREAGCRELVEEGRRIPLGKNYTVIATLHAGYEKILSYLTNVVIPVPDFESVAEGVFYMGGCLEARLLAQQLVKCLEELKAKLSHAPQYTFTLRLVKMAAVLTRHLANKYGITEDEALPQAIHTLMWSRLEKGDVKIYETTMNTLFAGRAGLKILNAALFKALVESEHKLPEPIVQMCVHMYDVMQCNFNVLMMAPDDRLINVLAEAVGKIYPTELPVFSTVDLNAPAEQLFGRYQHDNWLLGSLDRTIMSVDECKPTWLVFRGGLDQKADNLISLLDEARTFVSPGGTVKKLGCRTKVLFAAPSIEKVTLPFLNRVCVFKIA